MSPGVSPVLSSGPTEHQWNAYLKRSIYTPIRIMNTQQIQALLDAGAFPGTKKPATCVETHISWVILTPDFAFKIKKPVSFGFLDFSSLEKRRFFCTEEVRLNRRLAPDLYLGVLPIALMNGQLTIGATGAPPEDFAVQMRRVDEARQMDVLLKKGAVSNTQIQQLAAILADFHQKVVITDHPDFHPAGLWADFAELYRFGSDLEGAIGTEVTLCLQQWRSILPEFLEQHRHRFSERLQQGFWVDGHGDLHTRNIFLTTTGPLVFDCIEFSAHFRQSDILNELAFMCMDLEARQHPDLSETFIKAYNTHWEVFPRQEDRTIFLFFKAYRANVRLKVTLLELREHSKPELHRQARQYWDLLVRYLEQLK
ncbi:MAG: hypothetical protein EP344_12160 [Bacteroidetes bacterium]|nr:MAG: hypothetical protein EP344_12160 [Bacteroidota bacterium]